MMYRARNLLLYSATYQCNNTIAANNFLAETGQEEDPAKLVETQNIALATQGLFTSRTPTIACNYDFRDRSYLEDKFQQPFHIVQCHVVSYSIVL